MSVSSLPRETSGLIHADLTNIIIGAFFDVYNQLGRGFLESVYERALAITLREAGLAPQTQHPVPVYFRGAEVGFFRADILVDNAVVIEIKRARRIHSRHVSQLTNILRATPVEVGLLLNFGPRPVHQRLIYTNDRKGPVHHCG